MFFKRGGDMEIKKTIAISFFLIFSNIFFVVFATHDESQELLFEAIKNNQQKAAKQLLDFGAKVAKYQPISEELKKRIDGLSFKQGYGITLDDLVYIQIIHWGFDEQLHYGEMIVHKKVADDVVDIFQKLYEAKFSIEKMKLIDDYNADDNKSMNDNNSSALCCRGIVNQSNLVSKHALGLAIDINPIQNPYKRDDSILPLTGQHYLYREECKDEKGFINEDGIVYKAFDEKGWTWGGNWEKYYRDYMHFEKRVSIDD